MSQYSSDETAGIPVTNENAVPMCSIDILQVPFIRGNRVSREGEPSARTVEGNGIVKEPRNGMAKPVLAIPVLPEIVDLLIHRHLTKPTGVLPLCLCRVFWTDLWPVYRVFAKPFRLQRLRIFRLWPGDD